MEVHCKSKIEPEIWNQVYQEVYKSSALTK